MRTCFLLLLFSGCSLDDEYGTVFSWQKMPVATDVWIKDTSHFVNVKKGEAILLVVSGPPISLKKMRKRLVVLPNPSTEKISKSEVIAAIPFSLRYAADKKTIDLKPRLTGAGGIYGLYKAHDDGTFHLMYTFAGGHKLPSLRYHDMGTGVLPMVSDKRISFSFTFDQKILVENGALMLKHLSPHHDVPLDYLLLGRDQKTITAYLKPEVSALKAGATYGFFFGNGLRNEQGLAIKHSPLYFQAIKDSPAFIELKPITLSLSENSAKLSADLSKPWQLSWFVFTAGGMSCLAEVCPLTINSSAEKNSKKSLMHHRAQLMLTGLKPGVSYDSFVRIVSQEGQVVIKHDRFMTQPKNGLRITEIMVNPSIKNPQAKSLQYLEVANLSDSDVLLNKLYMGIENISGGQKKDCMLYPAPFLLPKQRRFLVVAQDFDAQAYHLPVGTLIVRLDQASLCGGFSSKTPKIITLHQGDGHFIDSYSGFLWPAPVGHSIQRIEEAGLDEPHNYCYSMLEKLTPGQENGPCN